MAVQNNFDDLKNDIDISIKTIENIPTIKTDSFSSSKLKEELIPILEEGKTRISNIEKITNNIDAVRGEIIEPVNKILLSSQRSSTKLSVVSLIFGLIGIFLTIYSFYSVKTEADYVYSLRNANQEVRALNISLKNNIDEINSLINKERISTSILGDLQSIKMNERSKLEKLFIPKRSHLNSIFWGLVKMVFVFLLFSSFILSIFYIFDDEVGVAFFWFLIFVAIFFTTYLFCNSKKRIIYVG